MLDKSDKLDTLDKSDKLGKLDKWDNLTGIGNVLVKTVQISQQ